MPSETFDTGFEFDERAVVREAYDFALQSLTDRVTHGSVDPRVGLDLLEAKRNTLCVRIELEHLHLDLIAHLEQFARVVDPSPGHVGDVKQTVDTAEIDERTVIGEVLDHAVDDLACRQRFEGVAPQLLSLGFEQRPAREDDVAASLVELDDLEFRTLTDQAFEVPHRSQINLRSGQECLHTDIHGETTLDSGDDGAFDCAIFVECETDLVPDLETFGFFL